MSQVKYFNTLYENTEDLSSELSSDQIFRSIFKIIQQFNVVVQLLSYVLLFATTWTVVHLDSLSYTISQSLLKSIESVMLSNHLILCHPLLLLTSVFPSIRVFSSEWALCIRWPNYWSFKICTNEKNFLC